MFLEFAVEQFGAEDLEGHFLVFDLGAAVLAADVDAGGEMEDLDGGFGAVDVLAAGAAGAADFDAEVFGAEFDIDFLGFGEDGDGDGGGVDAALGFGLRDALDAVDAGFVFEGAEYLFAGDFEDDFLESADFGGAAFEVLAIPAFLFGVALICAGEFAGEERGFVAAGTGADFDEGVAIFGGVGGQQRELELFGKGYDEGFQRGDFLGGHSGEVGVVGEGEFAVFGELAVGVLELVPEVDGMFQIPVFAQDVFGAGWIGEKIRVAEGFLDFMEAGLSAGDERGVVHGRSEGRKGW